MNSMNPRVTTFNRIRERGQTLVIALIVLGVLLILGFVFLGIIDRNIRNTGSAQNRSVASDLAEAGIRYAHSQLVTSELGADWRGTPTFLYSPNTVLSDADPDLFYMRPAAFDGAGRPLLFRSSTNPGLVVQDQGGPDGLGPYIRVNYSNGRALIRVTYGPSEANLFSSSPEGPLRNPGAARNYLHIESIGRPGLVNRKDPTTLGSHGAIQYSGFTTDAQLQQAVTLMSSANGQVLGHRLFGLVSIGIIEQALFITDIYHVSRPAEIGIPPNLGASYFDHLSGLLYDVASLPSYPNASPGTPGGPGVPAKGGGLGLAELFGGKNTLPNSSRNPVNGVSVSGSGGIFSNANLKLYGNINLSVNASLGEGLFVAGAIIPDPNVRLVINRSFQDVNGNWQESLPAPTFGQARLDSRQAGFDTDSGVIRDGMAGTDANGFSRSVGRKEPPSILRVDPATNQNRYVEMTRESGKLKSGNLTSHYGHGRGVYVDNFADRQNPADEGGRQNVGAQQSLVNEWLNPNSTSAWQGPYYIPPGAYVQLLTDGLVIIRDVPKGVGPDSTAQYWKDYDGVSTGSSLIRYRIGRATDGSQRIVDSTTPGIAIDSATLAPSDFDKGFPFNGVLYFEGNVRIQGIIPTDIQLTLVSNATIYIENSITKGVTGTEWTATRTNSNLPAIAGNARITYPPTAMLQLAAKDYVALNTTMFFGPSPSQALDVVNDVPNERQYKPVRMGMETVKSLSFISEFVLDPSVNPNNPSQWQPYATQYLDAVNGNPIPARVDVVHTLDDSTAGAATFVQMLINPLGLARSSQYYFPSTSPSFSGTTSFNGASAVLPGLPPYPMWGLGEESWQRYEKFEADEFPIVATGPGAVSPDGSTMFGAPGTGAPSGGYQLSTQGANEIMLLPAFPPYLQATGNYLLGRLSVTPHDIRVEASIFAEEGSFFVIPGPWMNPVLADRHDLYTTLGGVKAERQRVRIENFGSNPEFMFYGEPPDVKISIVGAIAENMPPPISQQAEALRKWGWIPHLHGATDESIPASHVPANYDVSKTDAYVPNLTYRYDPVLGTANTGGYIGSSPANAIRVDQFGRVLPPLPRLPVSPALAYFGEVG